MPFADLRSFLDELDAAGDLQRIKVPVDREWEVGAICRETFDEAARQFTLGLDGEPPLEPADVERVIATILGRMMITVFVSIGQERASLVGLIDRVMAAERGPVPRPPTETVH